MMLIIADLGSRGKRERLGIPRHGVVDEKPKG